MSHEIRTPAERHPRTQLPAEEGRSLAGPARTVVQDGGRRTAPAVARERHPRPVQDRGRLDGPGALQLPPLGGARLRRLHRPRRGRQQGVDSRGRHQRGAALAVGRGRFAQHPRAGQYLLVQGADAARTWSDPDPDRHGGRRRVAPGIVAHTSCLPRTMPSMSRWSSRSCTPSVST
jgi:hypothetical protein